MIKEILAFIFFDALGWLLLTLTVFEDELHFNPIENYLMWDEMNWIGVWVCTILYWVLFFPVAILLGIGVGIYKLFTFGRR